jgi:predicted nuclease with RNAse H fold
MRFIGGVDYGSKTAGTTAVVLGDTETRRLTLHGSLSGQDADAFLLQIVKSHRPQVLCIDAPLSLPGVYTRLPGCNDYFYRQADKQLQAMSPMFLGGLTARAMRLTAQLTDLGTAVYETYPAAQARRLGLAALGYKTKAEAIAPVVAQIKVELPEWDTGLMQCRTWHHVDALLAWLGAWRLETQSAERYGDEAEGLIYV